MEEDDHEFDELMEEDGQSGFLDPIDPEYLPTEEGMFNTTKV
jgi:hypothetical protein